MITTEAKARSGARGKTRGRSASTDAAAAPRAGSRSTLADVARHSGLSKTTVSAALNPANADYPISVDARRRIDAAVAALGYRPSYHGRALANGRTYAVGVLCDEVSVLGPVYEPAYRELADALQRRGYHVLYVAVGSAGAGGPEAPGGGGGGQLEWLLGERRLDAQVVMDFVNDAARDALLAAGVPTVFCNAQAAPGHSQVLVDERAGMGLLVDHLAGLGHRRIAYVEPTPRADGQRHYSEHTRRHLYGKLVAAAGLSAETHTLGRGHDEGSRDAAGLAGRLAAQPAGGRPTAFIAYSHLEAIGLLHELWRAGVRVPEDVSVAAFNDVYPTALTNPGLTVVTTVTGPMGRRVAELVLGQLDGPADPNADPHAGPATVLMPVELIVRGSTAPAPR